MHFKIATIKNKKFAVIGAIAAIVLAGALAFWHYFKNHSKDHATVDTQGTQERDRLKSLSTTVKSGVIETYVKAPGLIDFHPKYALRIHPTFPGLIIKVNKNLGDRVAAGETLATIESNVGIQTFTVTSPIAGLVLARKASEGQSVSPEEELFSVGDMGLMQARLAVSARDVNSARTGQDALLIAENQKVIRTKVNYLSPILSEDTRTATAMIEFQSADLKPGMFVTGALVIASRPIPRSLPFKFCEAEGNERKIYVLEADGPKERNVLFGARDYETCEILEGINAGDSVIPASLVPLNSHEDREEHHHAD